MRYRSLHTPSKYWASSIVRVFTDSRKRTSLSPCSVPTVAIVGHEHCGGAISALKAARRPPYEDQLERHHTLCDSLYHFIHKDHLNDVHDKDSKNPNDAITRWLTPLINRVKRLPLPDMEEAAVKIVIEENVKMQIDNIAQLDEWVREHAEKRPVWVHGWVYDFSTGFIRDLNFTKKLGGPA